MTWENTTCYKRNDKKRKPTSWEARSGPLRILITCGHIYYYPEWVMHCFSLGMDTVLLSKGISKEEAQTEAILKVSERLDALGAALTKLAAG